MSRVLVGPGEYPDMRRFQTVLEKYRSVRDGVGSHGIDAFYDVVESEALDVEEAVLGVDEDHLSGLVGRTQFEAEMVGSGGTVTAMQQAVECGAAYHIGGGYHHATRTRSTDMDLVNDLVIGVEHVRQRADVEDVMVVDLDLHHGDGTAAVYREDPHVLQLSAHAWGIYPGSGWVTETGDGPGAGTEVNLPVPERVGDDAYLDAVGTVLPPVMDAFDPDLVVYQSGVDPHRDDPNSTLDLTLDGLYQRDRTVFSAAGDRPVAVVTGGGYGPRAADAHVNTVAALADQPAAYTESDTVTGDPDATETFREWQEELFQKHPDYFSDV